MGFAKAIAATATGMMFLKFLNKCDQVTTPAGNLGIPRHQMPQVDGQHLPELAVWLKSKGVSATRKKMPLARLRMAQNELDKGKIVNMMKKFEKSSGQLPPVLVSSDGFVVDGTHRFLALYNLNPSNQIDVIQYNCQATQLLQLINQFPHAHNRTHQGIKI